MYLVCNSKKILAFWNVLFIIKFGISYGIEEKCQYCNKNFKTLGNMCGGVLLNFAHNLHKSLVTMETKITNKFNP